jgi:hypothetical protein
VPLNGNDVNLPAGGQLSWDGSIVASKNTDCGIAIQTPKGKVSASDHTVTLPGVNVSVPNPVPSILSKLPTPPGLPTGGSSGAAGGHGGKKSGGGGTVKYTPPPTTVPEKVMPRAVHYGGGGGYAPPAAGSGGGGGVAAPAPQPSVTSTVAAPTTSPAAKVKPAKTVDLAQHDQLGGAQLPVLLAILAILALSGVTAMYARLYLLRRR